MRILVSGATRTVRRLLPEYPDHLGILVIPKGNGIPGGKVPWAADNAAFSDWDPAAFCRLLGRVAGKPGLLWVTAPDVWPDAAETMRRFWVWLPILRELGLPVALVAQNGQESIPVPWDEIACLFLGGNDAWKLGRHAAALATEAKARGKLVHGGRVNTLKRLSWAHRIGCDTVDGTGFSRWAEQRLAWGLAHMRGLDSQRSLF